MAWAKKKGSGRREPKFGLAASLSELRLNPLDRIAAADDDKPKKKSAAKRTDSDGDDEAPAPAPRERKPQSRKSSKARSKGGARSGVMRLFYWGAVLGLWAGIAVVGVIVWVGAHLPPIQSLEIPKRPPTIQLVGLDGSVLAQRGEMAG